jgi:hypothetical protein
MTDLRTDPLLARWPGLEAAVTSVHARRVRDEATAAAIRAYLESGTDGHEVDVRL